MNLLQKGYVQHILAVIVLLVVSALYFFPEMQGKKLLSHDHISHVAAAKEIKDYKEKGETVLWASRVFSGMPAFQIAYTVDSNFLTWIHSLGKMFPRGTWLCLILMLGFYLCLSILEISFFLRILGSIIFSLSSWFMLSIEAGHATKMIAIAFVPPLIASIIISYKGKWLIGGILTAVFLGLAVVANHVQIVYYAIFFILAVIVVKFIQAYKEKTIPTFIKRSLILVGFALLGTLPNLTLLWTTYDYGKETIRGGKSELTKDVKQDTGLDIDYAMQWSYGKMESLNMLIPGLYGSGAQLDEDSEVYQDLKRKGVPKNQLKNYLKGIPVYYGDQPFTTGPSYMGATAIFLFILFLLISKSNFRWILLSVTVLSIMFAWGKNFLVINELMFDYLPLYNKFRTPSMWLSLTIVTVSLGAIMALNEILTKKVDSEKLKKSLIYAGSSVGGIVLLFALFGSGMVDFDGAYDAQLAQNGMSIDLLIEDRISILKGDAFRSFILIAIAFGLLWMYNSNKFKNINLLKGIMALLLIGDLWTVGKRYLNEDDFKKAKSFEQSIQPSIADQQINSDKSGNYRVFNTTVSTFNDNNTSYFHHSVGGYSAVKLIRYQDLIERHLSKGNMKVFNMLNTKYFIVGQPGAEAVQTNPDALGNAWFVDNVSWAKNADDEMAQLNDFEPKTTAVIDERFKEKIGNYQSTSSASDKIELSNYHPDNMKYSSNASAEKLAVFSEIWYKGNEDWKAYIDGKETEFVRVNYLLRGLKIPAGQHEITFKFKPKTHYTGRVISLISSILLLILLVGVIAAKALNKPLPGLSFDSETKA